MKIIRKAIYPSPCSLLFLPFLLSFFVRLRLLFPPLSFSLFASRPLLLYTYIEWECSRPWWTTCPVPDGNRGTFIRRSDRLDSNNLLILIILITSYFRTRCLHVPLFSITAASSPCCRASFRYLWISEYFQQTYAIQRATYSISQNNFSLPIYL